VKQAAQQKTNAHKQRADQFMGRDGPNMSCKSAKLMINNYCNGMVSRTLIRKISNEDLLIALEKKPSKAHQVDKSFKGIRSFRSEVFPISLVDVATLVSNAMELAESIRRHHVRG
jgi:hypothetical protein